MNKFERIESPIDPERCQGMGKTGQCEYKRVTGSDFCPRHGGNRAAEEEAKRGLRNYFLTLWRAEAQRASESDDYRSLREEIGLLRMMLQTRFNNHIKSSNDLIFHHGPIVQLIDKIALLVASCHKIESSMGNLLDRSAILQFGDELIHLVGNVLAEQPEVARRIADGILGIIGKFGIGASNDQD